MNQQNPKSELKSLNFLVGKWNTQGEVITNSGVLKITGIDSYEWALDGSFILHRADVMMGDERTQVIEMIGEYDKINKVYQMRSFDDRGSFTTMQAKLEQNNRLQIIGNNMRSLLSVNNDSNNMKAYWEKSEDGKTWLPWMDLSFHRM